ncbi:MAG: HDOD domain-containing protein [Desulfamplus sp.]|nr:HDOD domain-containing protein [Desulfamplus sp.]
MKILIAEDQNISREMLVKMLANIGQIEAFATGLEALKAFENAFDKSDPFQIMISDISMPVMSGLELLKAVRASEIKKNIDKEKRIKVLMFTSYADKDTIVSCHRAGCDDYAVKPFNKKVLVDKIKKFGFTIDETVELNQSDKTKQTEKTMGQMVSDAIEGFKKGRVDLPALPHIIQELQDLINSPNASVTDMAKIIENDTAISIKLIIAANSPFYGGVEKTKDVKMALNRLGLDVTQSIVAAIANKGLYHTKSSSIKQLMEKIWMHSFATAHCAREIAKKISSVGYEKAYVKGLIHDVGATLLIKNIGENATENTDIDINGLIEAVFEVHASFGGLLLNKWNFSKDFVSVASLHEWNKYGDKTEREVLIVNLADILSCKIGYGFFNKEIGDFEDNRELSDIQSAAMLGLTNSDLKVIYEKAEKDVAESASAFAKI